MMTARLHWSHVSCASVCLPQDPNSDLAASIVETIEADRTLVRVNQLVDRWNTSKRSLQRLFEDYVGVGPKWVINRYRMHEVLEHVHSGAAVDWPELALSLGYFDQSHFIRDFRALVGCSPMQYAKLVHARPRSLRERGRVPSPPMLGPDRYAVMAIHFSRGWN